jgi:MSHA biogenesis protein MshM
VYRKRFGLTHHPLPKDTQGRTFFEKTPGFTRLKRHFNHLAQEPGLGVLVADPGVGKTAAMRHLCAQLPRPDHQVLYLCDTSVSPLDLYRSLALELGVKPTHRRAQLWTDIKKALIHMTDERGAKVLVILDEAQHLSDRFLSDLSGFLNFAFDSRDLLTLWLVGLPQLERRLRLQEHAALSTRVVAQVRLDPVADRETFAALLDHGLKAAGAQSKLLSDPALELLFRASRGVTRIAARLLRSALQHAHERDMNFVDEHLLEAVIDELAHHK